MKTRLTTTKNINYKQSKHLVIGSDTVQFQKILEISDHEIQVEALFNQLRRRRRLKVTH